MQSFFHLSSKTMHPCFLTQDTEEEARRAWLCPGCSEPKQELNAVDVRIEGRVPTDKPINFVYDFSVALIHRELLDLLPREVIDRDLYVGRPFSENGKEIKDWATVRGRRGVFVRGTDHVKHQVCDVCQRNTYFALGRRYLYPAPSADATVFESQLHGLVVPPHIHDLVTAKSWRRLDIQKLHVLDEPLDGLGAIPFK